MLRFCYSLFKRFTDCFQIFEQENIFVQAGGAWANISFKNILFETSETDSFKRVHVNKPIRFCALTVWQPLGYQLYT
jgi:hypothetical protein